MPDNDLYLLAVSQDDHEAAYDIMEKAAMALIESWPRKKAGDVAGGFIVRDETPNCSSIGASLGDAARSCGVRDVPIGILGPAPSPSDLARMRLDRRIVGLADSIQATNELNPLIIVVDGYSNDATGYVLEGAHRINALDLLGAQSFPALVVFDEDAPAIHRNAAGEVVPLSTRFTNSVGDVHVGTDDALSLAGPAHPVPGNTKGLKNEL